MIISKRPDRSHKRSCTPRAGIHLGGGGWLMLRPRFLELISQLIFYRPAYLCTPRHCFPFKAIHDSTTRNYWPKIALICQRFINCCPLFVSDAELNQSLNRVAHVVEKNIGSLEIPIPRSSPIFAAVKRCAY